MKTFQQISLPVLVLTGLALAGCPSDDAPPVDDTTTGDTTTGGPTTVTPTTITDPDTTAGPATVTVTDTIGETETTETTGDPGDPYAFADADFDQYTQIDRLGFPAVNTGLNLLGDKDEYNAATPEDDAALVFLTNIFASLNTLHLGAPGMQTPNNTGLDDDLMALGLTPCRTPQLPMDNCDDQTLPFVIPDVIELRLDQPTGFPNGRQLSAPVMDVIFAVLLLDLSIHDITTFAGIPLNPPENDVEFQESFPYLAPAHR